MKNELPVVVAYGGGTNSVAMLCGFLDRGIRPDLILFADTGGELPHTYNHIELMSKKAQEWWGIPIEIVTKKYQGKFESLEQNCLRKRRLPSLAYGRKACSMKHKVEPQQKRVREWMNSNGYKEINKCIGYDFGEGHRATDRTHSDLSKGRIEWNWYPLIEWRWDRKSCIEAIKTHGIPLPGKSSCFFCPSMKLAEIMALRQNYPEYYNRAIAIEENVLVQGPKEGLHFGTKWSDIVKADDDQLKMFEWLDQHDPQHQPCGCYDG